MTKTSKTNETKRQQCEEPACDRFGACSAPICPVDPQRTDRTMVDGEASCFYMLQAAKKGSAERFSGGPNEGVFKAAAKLLVDVKNLPRPLRKALQRASKQGRRVIAIKPSQRVTSVQSTEEEVRAEAHT